MWSLSLMFVNAPRPWLLLLAVALLLLAGCANFPQNEPTAGRAPQQSESAAGNP